MIAWAEIVSVPLRHPASERDLTCPAPEGGGPRFLLGSPAFPLTSLS